MNSNKLYICFQEGPRADKKLSFTDKEAITFGRDSGCDIIFNTNTNPTISRQHARLEYSSGHWHFIDTSTNGSIVDGKKIHNTKVVLEGGEKILLSPNGETLSVQFDDVSDSISSETQYGKDLASMTKIIPLSKEGFVRELSSQSFFVPGIATVVSGIMFFFIFSSAIETGDIIYAYLYELLLGLYIGLMMIYFLLNVSNLKVPIWLPIGTALFTSVILLVPLPFYIFALIFRPPIISQMMESQHFSSLFIGHLIGAGLCEELFKSIPVWLALLLAPRLNRLNIAGFKEKYFTPTVAMLIGASSGIGFIIVETLQDYVFSKQGEQIGLGMMLLIPRFITGISGHVAWSGIFAYFIGLGSFYKKGMVLYPFMGWMIASLLHGLWNATGILDSELITIGVALISFIGFIAYLYKSSQTFSTQTI